MTRPPAETHTDPDSPYWAAVANGVLVHQSCSDCGYNLAYPKKHCPRCGSRHLTWQESSGQGTVYSFTVVHRAPNAALRDRVPYVLALVDLDRGVRRMTWIVDCPPERVHIGMPVQAVFRTIDGRTIPVFVPNWKQEDEQE